MHNRLHLACLKMTEVWIMSDLQPIQEVLIIEIIEKCTPCRIYMEKLLFQTNAVFSLWSCQLISPSSNFQCLSWMLCFSTASFKVPCRSRKIQVGLACLQMANREAKWQCTCLNTVNIWCEHICHSWCCTESMSPQTICVCLTSPGNTVWAPHLKLAIWETPAQESNNGVKLLTSGQILMYILSLILLRGREVSS